MCDISVRSEQQGDNYPTGGQHVEMKSSRRLELLVEVATAWILLATGRDPRSPNHGGQCLTCKYTWSPIVRIADRGFTYGCFVDLGLGSVQGLHRG